MKKKPFENRRLQGDLPLRITLWPPRDLSAALEWPAGRRSVTLAWKPPLLNAREVGGYEVERKSWWPGRAARTEMLAAVAPDACAFRDEAPVADFVNEYRVRALHRRFGAAAGAWSFPAAAYGFAFARYGDMVAELKALARDNPAVCRLVDAGPAALGDFRVWCAVLGTDTGDFPDRPGLFLAGNPHGSEIEGGDVCLGLVRETLRRWRAGDPVVRGILETTQIRVIPFYNPCGRSSSEAGYPGGVRKTRPARLLPPHWDPLQRRACWRADTSGGLDPNRTFDAGWEAAPETASSRGSGNYPGRRPGAAPETRALVRQALALRPQISVNYHGPCGYPLLPGDLPGGRRPADRPLHHEVGRAFARLSDPDFANDVPDESPHPTQRIAGVAQNWFYRAFYGAHLLPEGFYGQVPSDHRVLPVAGSHSIPELVARNFEAMLWLAGRIHGSGLVVRARGRDGRPVEADVEVVGRMDPGSLPQRTDRRHGTYRRLLSPGVYTVRVRAADGRSVVFRGVRVGEGKPALLEAVFGPSAARGRER